MIGMSIFAKSITAQRQSYSSHINGTRVLITELVIVTRDGEEMRIDVHAKADETDPLTVTVLPDRFKDVASPAAEGERS